MEPVKSIRLEGSPREPHVRVFADGAVTTARLVHDNAIVSQNRPIYRTVSVLSHKHILTATVTQAKIREVSAIPIEEDNVGAGQSLEYVREAEASGRVRLIGHHHAFGEVSRATIRQDNHSTEEEV